MTERAKPAPPPTGSPRIERPSSSSRPPRAPRAPEVSEVSKVLSLQDATNLLSYSDVLSGDDLAASKEHIDKDPAAQKYASTLIELSGKHGRTAIVDRALDIKAEFDRKAEALSIEPSVWGRSLSWAMWDIAKQSYLADHPSESDSTKYDLADPMLDSKDSEKVRGQIVDRMIGFEYLETKKTNPEFSLDIPDDAQKSVDKILADATREGRQLHSYELAELGSLLDQSPKEVIPGSAEARFATKTNPGSFNTKGWEPKEYPAGNPNPLFRDGTYGTPYDAEAAKAAKQSERKAQISQRVHSLANAAFTGLSDTFNLKTFGGAKTEAWYQAQEAKAKKSYRAEKRDPALERENPLKGLFGRIGEVAKRNHKPKDRDTEPNTDDKEKADKSGKASERYNKAIIKIGNGLNFLMKLGLKRGEAAKARRAERNDRKKIAELEKSLVNPDTDATKPERDSAIARVFNRIGRAAMINFSLMQKVGFEKYFMGYLEPSLRAKGAELKAKLPKSAKSADKSAKPAES